jgi:hypothetical protein
MASYGWSEDYVRKQLTGAKGWVYYNWAKENAASLLGALWERKSPGYVAQERQRWLLTRAKSQ